MNARRAIAALVFVLVCAIPAVALAETVVRIDVEGVRRIEADAVISKMTSRVGDDFSLQSVDQDIKAIYGMGYFYDVSIDRTDVEGGVSLTVTVSEKPAVQEYVFVGNKHIGEEKIKENTDLKPNTILSDAKIKENIYKIVKMYEDDGYFMVDITYRLEELPNNRVKVVIEINEFKKVYIKRINFLGNRAFTDEELRKHMMTREGDLWSFMGQGGIYKPEILLNDVNMLRGWYLDHGFLEVQISEPVVSLSADRRNMFVAVTVEEGPQYYVGKLDIEGDLLFEKESLMKLVTLKTGDLFHRGKFEESTNALRAKYTDIGFAFAEVTADTPTNPQTRIIDITFKVNKGKLAYFEKIVITGNTSTRDKVVRRELSIKEGDLYSGPGIRRSKERLMRLGYFDEVAISTERGSTDESVSLLIRVKERMQGSFMVGVGFSSLESFVGTATISHNNLFGYGTKLSLNAEVGKFRKNFQLKLREPYLLDSRWIGTLGLVNSEQDYFQFDRFDKAISAGFGYPLYWDVEAHVSYGYRSVEIKNVENQAALFLTLQEGRTISTSTTYTLSRDTVNSPFDPTDGSRVSASVEWASEYFGGELEFMKYVGQARRYFPIWKGISIMVNGEGGYGYDLNEERLHITERWFLGGLNTVRGFPLRSLGPEDSSIIATDPGDPASTLTEVSTVIGGNKYLQGNIELLIPIVKELNIKGVLFYDAGNALAEEEWFALDGFRQSWGFGVRWISPIGPLRFEWGYPLHPRDDERTQNFEFGIGTFF
ncbi:MAG: outer membrane protein assembly factor BamA [Deltaproteobacteria bacterium]|nr:outer membrane protein assembly factor BamA [Deltaproteobacteria bacterium]